MANIEDPLLEQTPITYDPIVVELHGRVAALESRENARNMEIALIKNDLGYIKDGQDKLYAGLNRILWAIALSVLAAGTTFVLSGGLSVVQP